jgi:predicted RNA-binding Zn-ribbon protein involved in translation (DUF1610 family)
MSRLSCWKTKACGWEGPQEDLVPVFPGRVQTKLVCPKCGAHTMRPARCKIRGISVGDLGENNHCPYYSEHMMLCDKSERCENQYYGQKGGRLTCQK